jgi:hypothetical protein
VTVAALNPTLVARGQRRQSDPLAHEIFERPDFRPGPRTVAMVIFDDEIAASVHTPIFDLERDRAVTLLATG